MPGIRHDAILAPPQLAAADDGHHNAFDRSIVGIIIGLLAWIAGRFIRPAVPIATTS
jgi:hypothetical protein